MHQSSIEYTYTTARSVHATLQTVGERDPTFHDYISSPKANYVVNIISYL